MANVNPLVWGKTIENKAQGVDDYYPLLGHMLDTATVAGILWDDWLRDGIKELIVKDLGESARSMFQLAAGLHDLGKCSPIFQGQMLSGKRSKPEKQAELENDGFPFPKIADVKGMRLKSIHRHEKLGMYGLTHSTDSPLKESSESWLELVLLGHHGSFKISYGNRRNSHEPELKSVMGGKWTDEQNELIAAVEMATGSKLSDALTINGVSDETIILLSGAIILADRIASNDLSVGDAYGKMVRKELSINEPAQWISERMDFLWKLSSRELGFAVQLSDKDILGDYSPRGIQKVFPPERGLWICMAPTGAGKTEAALLRHSAAKERLMFLLPTLSTTNAMMGRLLKTYGSKSPTTAVLGHGLAYLEDFYTNRNMSEIDRENVDDCGLIPSKFSSVSGAKLSASINVATIDQLLMGAFPIKWSALRWILVANSHVVIDEAHLLDHYQVELLSPLLGLLGKTGARVSILSATLPNWLENKLTRSYSFGSASSSNATIFPSSVLIGPTTNDAEAFERDVRIDIEVEGYSAAIEIDKSQDSVAGHIQWAESTMKSYPRARLGVFVNQVKRAQNIAKELRRILPADVEVICLHSRMLAKHRKQITDRLVRDLRTGTGSLERVVLVGTQVIEMSLDIDLDLISTDLCPAPSLIQRMGRAWRDKSSESRFERIDRSSNPTMRVRIAIPVDEEGALRDKELLPYRESVLLRTSAYLTGRERINLPDDLQSFVETVMVNTESIESRGEEDEFADTIYRTMRGKDVAIDAGFLAPGSLRTLTVQQYGPTLTDSDLISEAVATRLIEGLQGEPFIIRSPNPNLQRLGALNPETELHGIGFRAAQSASVALSMRMSSLIEKDDSIEKLEIKDLKSWGYFGDLPAYLDYDELVGLMEVEQ